MTSRSDWVFDSKRLPLQTLIGKTFTDVYRDDNEVVFENNDEAYCLTHIPFCCESVEIDDINGDLADLVGVPILNAHEATNKTDPPKSAGDESYTWSFYHFRTSKGYVTIRWYGESNGHYSEKVDLVAGEKSQNS